MNAHAILNLYRTHGHWIYEGEGVSQLVHGWQCAQLAKASNATPALVLAAWLHDVGHLLEVGANHTPTLFGINDSHEAKGANAVDVAFGITVAQPIRLHVAAKRYLVGTQPSYAKRLSDDSVRSLALQGGAFTSAQCESYRQQASAQDALKLRVWDDAAKRTDWIPASQEAALTELSACMTLLQSSNDLTPTTCTSSFA